MDSCTREVVDSNNRQFDRVVDLFHAVLGEHFHWGYFVEGTTSLRRAQDALIDELLSLTSIQPSSKVLDVGCGIGGTVRYISQRHGCAAVGITNNERSLALAGKLNGAQDTSRGVTFALADALDNGFPDESVDIALMIEAAYMIPDKRSLLAENRRVLKPGGTLLVCDNMAGRALSPKEMFKFHREIFAMKEIFGEGTYESLEGYSNLAHEARFREVSTFDFSTKVTPTIEHVVSTVRDQRDELLKMFRSQEVDNWLKTWTFTSYLCQNGASGYGVLRAVK